MITTRQSVEEQTGRLFGQLWHQYNDQLFTQSVDLFATRWAANGEPADFFRGRRCLDAGCGGGRYAFAMAQMGAASVVGVDVGVEGIADATRRRDALCMARVEFRQASVLDLPFGDGEFDFVCCSGVLHHTVSVERGLAEIHRVLAPGGSVYLLLYAAGGQYWPLNSILRSFAAVLGCAEVDRCIAAAGLPSSKRRTILDDLFVPILETYTWERVESLLREAGFQRWRRWSAGQLDHESNVDALTADLKLRTAMWRAGARSGTGPMAGIEDNLARICAAVTEAVDRMIEQHRAGLLSAEALQAAVIGTGHHRVIAERP